MLELPPGYTFTYDAENRQVSKTGGATPNATYVYDGAGNRVEKILSSGQSTVYVYDGLGNLAAEYAPAATLSKENILFDDQPVAIENAVTAPCATCYLSFDQVNSLRMVTDGSANVIARHDYIPFGEEIPGGIAGRSSQFGPGLDNVSQRFTGKEQDTESSLDYFGTRYYTAGVTRFMSPDDPANDQYPNDPQSWNLFSYVRNNPMSNIDLLGEDCITTSGQSFSGITVTTLRGGSAETCSGTFVDGTVDTSAYTYSGTSLGYSFSTDTAGGAGTISFGQDESDALSPDVANMLHQAGDMAAPLVNLSGEGLKLGASLAFPFTSFLANLALGSDPTAVQGAGMNRKPGKLGQFKGRDA